MLTLTKFGDPYCRDVFGEILNDHGWRIEKIYSPTWPCEPARRWMRSQAKKGLTPKQIWYKCNNPEWIKWILCRFNLNDDVQSIVWHGETCDELRALVKWGDVRRALIKAGWR